MGMPTVEQSPFFSFSSRDAQVSIVRKLSYFRLQQRLKNLVKRLLQEKKLNVSPSRGNILSSRDRFKNHINLRCIIASEMQIENVNYGIQEPFVT